MNLVKFPTSGTFFLRDSYTGSLSSGSLLIINEELGLQNTVASGLDTPGSFFYNLDDPHTSKDSYTLIPFGYGKVGEAYPQSGFSPTIEIKNETFQDIEYLAQTSGSPIIDSRDFEDITLSGFDVLVTGTGITTSGLVNSTSMEGDYFVRLNSSAQSALILTAQDVAASGMLSGRAIMLTRNGTSTSTAICTGLAFMRQGNGLTDNAYKIYLSIPATNTYRLNFNSGALSTTGGNINSGGTSVWTEDLTFSTNALRNASRNIWLMVEWEQKEQGIAYNVYYKYHVAGDTIEDVKNNATLLRQELFTGNATGANYITTPSGSPCWFLSSTSSNELGMDMFHLEAISGVQPVGLHGLNLIKKNEEVTATQSRPQFSNILMSPGPPTGPEGSPNFGGTINPTVPAEDSWIGVYGYNFLGLQVSYAPGGDTGDNIYGFFTFTEPLASGITHGVFRTAFLSQAGAGEPKLGLCFLRQGDLYDSDCYVLEKFRNGTNDHRVRIRKGTPFSATLNDTADFTGTTLATSALLPSWNDGSTGWIELRWKADQNLNKVDIEILFKVLNSADRSPGNLDYNLTQVLTYTDISSPYLTTDYSPMLICKGDTNPFRMYKFELRRAR